jgi:hypothetical protein
MQRSLHNWIIDHRPLTDGEDDFILHVNDLVAPMKKNEPGGQQGNQIETIIADHAAANAGKFIHVRPFHAGSPISTDCKD